MAIKFYLTDIGRNAVLEAANIPSLKIELSHIAVGTAKYNGASAQSNTTLINEIARYPLNGGSVDEYSHTLRFIANIESTVTADIFEIGLYTDRGVLFAIAATATNNELIHLSLDIVSILTFGLVLTDVELSKIVVNIDSNSPIAVALMNQHLSHSNPHPQYAFLEDFENLRDDLLVWAELVDGKTNDLQTQLSDTVEALQQQLSNLASGLASLYPKVILSGVIKQGQAREINRPAGSNISFLDTRYAIQLTPEGVHEGWGISRQDARIGIDVFNRSGNSRVGYSGNICWSVIQVEGLTSSTGNGSYVYTGTPVVFPILAGESKAFTIIGAGGGGGSSRYDDLNVNPNPATLKGQNGQDSYISIDNTTIKFTAGGGFSGTGGISGDNGQKINGIAGAGGNWLLEGEYASASRFTGQSGNATAADHTGASSDTESRGAGGDGADSSVDAGIAFGGGAGEGARLSMIYTNNSPQTQYVRLYVGKGGTGERSLITTNEEGNEVTPDHYVVGEDGSHGFIRVASAI